MAEVLHHVPEPSSQKESRHSMSTLRVPTAERAKNHKQNHRRQQQQQQQPTPATHQQQQQPSQRRVRTTSTTKTTAQRQHDNISNVSAATPAVTAGTAATTPYGPDAGLPTGTSVPSQAAQLPVNAGDADCDDLEDGEDELMCGGLQRVTVVVLGARGVGKTSLVRQFVYGDAGYADSTISQPPPSQRHTPSARQPTAATSSSASSNATSGSDASSKVPVRPQPTFYHVAVVVDRRLYDVRLVDCPPITRFPSNAVQEWTEFRGYGLRHAAAYVIVYDVTDDESFAYVRSMREQISQCRAASAAAAAAAATSGGTFGNGSTTGQGTSLNVGGGSGSGRSNTAAASSSFSGFASSQYHCDVPIIVAANKVDLVLTHNSGGSVGPISGGMVGGCVIANGGNGGVDKNGLTAAAAAAAGRAQRDAANIVRKQWKCTYVECSARYNWRVVALFRDLMKSVDHSTRLHRQQLASGHHHHHHGGHLSSAAGSIVRVQDALHNNHCNIL